MQEEGGIGGRSARGSARGGGGEEEGKGKSKCKGRGGRYECEGVI